MGHWPNMWCKNDVPNKGLLRITKKNMSMRYREALMLLFKAENNVKYLNYSRTLQNYAFALS